MLELEFDERYSKYVDEWNKLLKEYNKPTEEIIVNPDIVTNNNSKNFILRSQKLNPKTSKNNYSM